MRKFMLCLVIIMVMPLVMGMQSFDGNKIRPFDGDKVQWGSSKATVLQNETHELLERKEHDLEYVLGMDGHFDVEKTYSFTEADQLAQVAYYYFNETAMSNAQLVEVYEALRTVFTAIYGAPAREFMKYDLEEIDLNKEMFLQADEAEAAHYKLVTVWETPEMDVTLRLHGWTWPDGLSIRFYYDSRQYSGTYAREFFDRLLEPKI